MVLLPRRITVVTHVPDSLDVLWENFLNKFLSEAYKNVP